MKETVRRCGRRRRFTFIDVLVFSAIVPFGILNAVNTSDIIVSPSTIAIMLPISALALSFFVSCDEHLWRRDDKGLRRAFVDIPCNRKSNARNLLMKPHDSSESMATD
jgi:hypothetical protein